jgi:hypothetical protein
MVQHVKHKTEIPMKRPQNDLVLTSIFMQPEPYARFKEIARAEGTTAATMIRGFVLQTVRRAEKLAAQEK